MCALPILHAYHLTYLATKAVRDDLRPYAPNVVEKEFSEVRTRIQKMAT
jgi:hypothetical protein